MIRIIMKRLQQKRDTHWEHTKLKKMKHTKHSRWLYLMFDRTEILKSSYFYRNSLNISMKQSVLGSWLASIPLLKTKNVFIFLFLMKLMNHSPKIIFTIINKTISLKYEQNIRYIILGLSLEWELLENSSVTQVMI